MSCLENRNNCFHCELEETNIHLMYKKTFFFSTSNYFCQIYQSNEVVLRYLECIAIHLKKIFCSALDKNLKRQKTHLEQL